MLIDPENKEVTDIDLKRYKIGGNINTPSALAQSIVLHVDTRYYGAARSIGCLSIQSVRSKIETDKGQKYAY